MSKMPRGDRRAVAIAIALSLTSCTGWNDPLPLIPSQNLNPATGATVKSTEETGFITVSTKGDTYIAAVDGIRLPSRNRRPVLLAPGKHELSVTFQFGAFGAMTMISAELNAGATYLVKGVKEAPCYAKFWLQDGSGAILGGQQVVPFTSASAVVPITSGSTFMNLDVGPLVFSAICQ
jgi:hypothetical protein